MQGGLLAKNREFSFSSLRPGLVEGCYGYVEGIFRSFLELFVACTWLPADFHGSEMFLAVIHTSTRRMGCLFKT